MYIVGVSTGIASSDMGATALAISMSLASNLQQILDNIETIDIRVSTGQPGIG